MAFFGIGGSNKNPKAADGVVHDSKQAKDAGSQDILEEFEAQFSSQNPVQPPPESPLPAPEPAQQPEQRTAPDVSTPPPEPLQQTPPTNHPAPQPAPPGAPEPIVPDRARTAPRPQPAHDLPDFDFDFHPSDPFRTQPTQPSTNETPAPARQTVPSEPSGRAQAHPPPEVAQSAPIAQEREEYPMRPLPTQASAHPAPDRPEPRPEPARRSQNDLPDFVDALGPDPDLRSPPELRTPQTPPSWLEENLFADEEPVEQRSRIPPEEPRRERPRWLDAQEPVLNPLPLDEAPSRPKTPPQQTQPKRSVPPRELASPETKPVVRPPAHHTAPPERYSVVRRGGALFMDKNVLAGHVSDLGELRGISHATHERFSHIDSLSKDEKKTLTKLQSTLQAMHDGLEHTDQLLFTGD